MNKTTLNDLFSTDGYLVTWLIQIDRDEVMFKRLVNGEVDESYAPVSRDKANVYAAAILNGLEPPRHLQLSNIQIG